MRGATLYIVRRSAWNRAAQRLRRLREPRYLLGALVGIAYLTATYVTRSHALDLRRSAGMDSTPSPWLLGLAGPSGSAVALAVLALACWVFPARSNLLEFSDAERAFLFPSPLSRAQLVLYRLMRSQSAVLLGSFIVALAYPTGSVPGRLRGMLAVWLLLMTSHVFFTGVTVARMGTRGWRLPARILTWLAVLQPAAGLVSLGVGFTSRPVRPVGSSDTLDLLLRAASQAPTLELLAPFRLVAGPLFAASWTEYAVSLVLSAAVYGIAVLWLVVIDGEANLQADAPEGEATARPKAGPRRYVVRWTPWSLAATGRPETALLWKGMLRSVRTVDRRVWLRLGPLLLWLVGATLLVTQSPGLTALIGVGATWGALFCLFMGPQMVRLDLRQELASIALMKTWPLPGATILRGLILWPAISVTVMTWGFAALALVFTGLAGSREPGPMTLAGAAAFFLVSPGIIFTEYTAHNGVAVLFPAWVPVGPSRGRGVDAAGQRLILLLANWLGLALALAPGAGVTTALWFGLPGLRPWTLPVGAAVTTLMVGAELWVLTGLLGRAFERLDETDAERGE